MSGISQSITRRRLLSVILIGAMILCFQSFIVADDGDGHIGGKPDIGQGDGVPQDRPGTIRAGEQQQKLDGEYNQGTDPAEDGGDGIPNGGPTEGMEHDGPGDGPHPVIDNMITFIFSYLL
jgi:hypothetical protein